MQDAHIYAQKWRAWLKIKRESRKLISDLIEAGFELVSIKGSHHKYRKGPVSVIVPHPK